MAESPGSPLSSIASEEFDELKHEDDASSGLTFAVGSGVRARNPNKRVKVGAQQEQDTDISSDTSGSIPGSPTALSVPDEDGIGQERANICEWDGCTAGDLGDMDSLVQHIHDNHIIARQKIYYCEWKGCSRKGKEQPSGYALKAHIRSHTREKPFYCALPECDRCFTRSDALAKHMRTVHETESLRPSDPIPKNYSLPPGKTQRLKLTLSKQPSNGEEPVETSAPVDYSSFPSELQFTEAESARDPKDLIRLLRAQLQWAEEERVELEAQLKQTEDLRKKEWEEKELLLLTVVESEKVWNERRRNLDATNPNSGYKGGPDGVLPDPPMQYIGEQPWFRNLPDRKQVKVETADS